MPEKSSIYGRFSSIEMTTFGKPTAAKMNLLTKKENGEIRKFPHAFLRSFAFIAKRCQ